MPRYDYDCAACGTRFEAVHGVHADGPSTCPTCGGGPVKKAFAPPAIHFKGSGWAKKERRATASAGASKSTGTDANAATTGSSATESGATSGTATATDGASSSTTSSGAGASASSSSAGD